MKKVCPDGARIKQLRTNSEKASTQKELAYEIRVSERTLRQIENQNAPVGVDVLDRIAKWFGVHRAQICKSIEATGPSPQPGASSASKALAELFEDRIVPRHDYDLAYATTDEGRLFKEASRTHDVVCSIDITLSDETAGYAEELFDILRSLTWEARDCRFDIPATKEIAIRRRIKMLLVLLKGNDVWVYQTSFFRRLPERYDPLPEGEYPELRSRLVVALGPPGEYGEVSIKVPIDHGQPFFLPGWAFDREATDADA
jgi:transcriptional regulator with XRE-family HTH domain